MGFRDRLRSKLGRRDRSESKNSAPDTQGPQPSPSAGEPTQDALANVSSSVADPDVEAKPDPALKCLWDLAWEKFESEHAKWAETFREHIANLPDLQIGDQVRKRSGIRNADTLASGAFPLH